MPLILGVDPGSRKTGFGIVRVDDNHPSLPAEYITCGIIKLAPNLSIPERLKQIFIDLSELINEYNPSEMAIEQVFMSKSAGSALKLGQARGAAIVAGATSGMEIAEYSARQIKQSVVGTGAAKKEQVQHMVMTLLKLPAAPSEDAADALAAALCHAHTRRTTRLTGVTSVKQGRWR